VTPEALQSLIERLGIYRQTLRFHLDQLALQGEPYAMPALRHGIAECHHEIQRLKAILRSYEVDVQDLPDDSAGAPTTSGVNAAPASALRPSRVDLAIVTAMNEELEPVLNVMGGRQGCSTFLIDNFIHYAAQMQIGSRSLSVVACSLWKYGGDPTTAAVLRLKPLAPRLLAMTGICAGWEDKDIHFGDVIVAERAFHAGEGKETATGFQPDPHTYSPPPWLVSWLRDFSHDQEWHKNIQTPRPRSLRYQAMWVLCRLPERSGFPNDDADWQELKAEQIDFQGVKDLLRRNRLITQHGALTRRAQALLAELRQRNYGIQAPLPDPPQPQVHYGTFASTRAVVAVEDPFFAHAKRMRSVRAIELEVASLFAAAVEIGVPAFAVKGVSDHGTPDKDDAFHAYAAEASARWAEAFIRRYAQQLPLI
jgi:nucleoside phosphorylase